MPYQAETKIVHFDNLLRLAVKIADELRYPKQLLSASRRKELASNARTMLLGSLHRIEETTKNLESEILLDMHTGITKSGIPFYLVDTHDLSIVVHQIPDSFRVEYVPNCACDRTSRITDQVALAGFLPATTCQSNVSGFFGMAKMPSEGFSNHDGILQPFAIRKESDQCQHGGILILNGYTRIEILSYSELEEYKNVQFAQGEALIEANWYMDSNNQNEVCARDNLQGKNVYNCIGEFFLPNSSKLIFTFSSYRTALESALNEIGNPDLWRDSVACTMRTVAAMCNLIASKNNAVGWRIAGLEFNGGGLITHALREKSLKSRDYFIFMNSLME